MREVRVFDGFVPDPAAYRAEALSREFRSYEFPDEQGKPYYFHGIFIPTEPTPVTSKLCDLFPAAIPTLTFFRKSPLGQEEPHFIHTDIDMGDWSAILYLNPTPPEGDGTSFWTHKATGAIESPIPHERSKEGRTALGWDLRQHVPAKFNRLILFPSSFFHSRAIPENWGEGDEARLTQVTFGRGDLFE